MNKWVPEQPSPWRKSSKRESCYADRVYIISYCRRAALRRPTSLAEEGDHFQVTWKWPNNDFWVIWSDSPFSDPPFEGRWFTRVFCPLFPRVLTFIEYARNQHLWALDVRRGEAFKEERLQRIMGWGTALHTRHTRKRAAKEEVTEEVGWTICKQPERIAQVSRKGAQPFSMIQCPKVRSEILKPSVRMWFPSAGCARQVQSPRVWIHFPDCNHTPGPPTKSFPTKSPWVKLSERLPMKLYGHENSHPLELRVCLSQTLWNPNS